MRSTVGALSFLLTLVLVNPRTGAAPLENAPGPVGTAVGAHTQRAVSLAQSYDRWKSSKPEADRAAIVVPVSWIPGISVTRSEARGLVTIDLETGAATAELDGIDLTDLREVWVIDNRPSVGASALPDATDLAHFVGTLQIEDGTGTLNAQLDLSMFRDFDIDQVVVALEGRGPVDGGVLYGSLSLFDRLHRVSRRLELGQAPIAGDESSRRGALGDFSKPTALASETAGAKDALGVLIDEGETLFFEETFDGNGRTCGTCHPAENNFTLDPAFIATLPSDDPLFVAEFVPELDHLQNGGLFFENPVLMREFALIVENPDGFDDLTSNFVMRSVNHLFALELTKGNPSGVPCETIPPFDRLGWGGDGATGSGTLREFSTAAVIQHTPNTLARVAGEDFRLPTDEELDALEAFQLTLGRQIEIDLRNMVFADPDVIAGQALFFAQDGGRCNVCHEDAGALRKTPLGVRNANFDIGVFNVNHPAIALGEEIPRDDGFGSDHVSRRCFATFSTPSIIEAADTPPFEHNNVFATLEEAIAHYSTDEFNTMSSAGVSTTGDIDLTEDEVNQLGALLRVLNALRNGEDVRTCDARVRSNTDPDFQLEVLALCIADNEDAIEVLSEGPLALHADAQAHFVASLDLHNQAVAATTLSERNAALNAAGIELKAARDAMTTVD